MFLLNAFLARASHAKELVSRSWLKLLVSAFLPAISLYDLAISQLLAEDVAQGMPKLREILEFLHLGLDPTTWALILLCLIVVMLFEDGFQRAHPKSFIKAAVLRLNYSSKWEAFDIFGSTNVESAERRLDGHWDVQFKQRVDPRTLTARVPDGEEVTVSLTNAGPRRARVAFSETAPLSHIMRDNPLDIIFECAET